MLDFTYGVKVQLIFLKDFLKTELFESYLKILSFCSYCFYPVVLEKSCMYAD